MTYGEIFKKFKGVDGDIWLNSTGINPPTEDGTLAGIKYFDKVIEFYRATEKKKKRDLVFLYDINDIHLPSVVENNFVFSGYEVGVYSSMYNYWSCIANEIINGTLSEMQMFSNMLNDNLLFSCLDDVNSFLSLRQKLCQKGHAGIELEDLESMTDGESCHVFKVFLYRE